MTRPLGTAASPIEVPDLGSIMAGTSVGRAGELPAMQKRPPRPDPAPAVATTPTQTVEPAKKAAPRVPREPAAAPAPRARPKPRGRGKKAVDPDATGAYLPITLYEQFNEYWRTREDTKVSYTDIIFDAIEAQDRAKRLDTLVAESLPGGARAGHLFTGRVAQRRIHEGHSKPVTLRPGDGDLSIIDALAEKHGAINRSHFIEVCLAAYLAAKMGRRHDEPEDGHGDEAG